MTLPFGPEAPGSIRRRRRPGFHQPPGLSADARRVLVPFTARSSRCRPGVWERRLGGVKRGWFRRMPPGMSFRGGRGRVCPERLPACRMSRNRADSHGRDRATRGNATPRGVREERPRAAGVIAVADQMARSRACPPGETNASTSIPGTNRACLGWI